MNRTSSGTESHPWHLLWVFAALAFAGTSATRFYASGEPFALLASLAWLGWAFSWYTKPFQVRWQGKISEAVRVQPLHPKVPEKLWSIVTIASFLLLLASVALRFAIPA